MSGALLGGKTLGLPHERASSPPPPPFVGVCPLLSSGVVPPSIVSLCLCPPALGKRLRATSASHGKLRACGP